MPVILQVPSNTYSAGRHDFVYPQRLDPTWSQISITLTRESWPDTGSEILTFGFDISFDDGQTWNFLASGGTPGGNIGRANTFIGLSIQGVGQTNRRLRGFITNVVPVTTTIAVSAS